MNIDVLVHVMARIASNRRRRVAKLAKSKIWILKLNRRGLPKIGPLKELLGNVRRGR
jgi:hypothetical protein